MKTVKELGKIPERAMLVSLDMCSLYTSIPNKQAIDAILEHVRKDPETKILCSYKMGKLVEMILHMNYFEFNKQLYLKISGTAMETLCAPSLANLFM